MQETQAERRRRLRRQSVLKRHSKQKEEEDIQVTPLKAQSKALSPDHQSASARKDNQRQMQHIRLQKKLAFLPYLLSLLVVLIFKLFSYNVFNIFITLLVLIQATFQFALHKKNSKIESKIVWLQRGVRFLQSLKKLGKDISILAGGVVILLGIV